MGCQCDTAEKVGEFNYEEEINNSYKSVIEKSKKNSTNADQEIEIIQNKFIEEINEKEDYTILKSIDIREYLTYECLQAFEIFSNENYQFKKIFDNFSKDFENKKELYNKNDDDKEENEEENEDDNEEKEDEDNIKDENDIEYNGNDDENNNHNNLENLKIFKMPPIKYLKNDSIYEGEFFYDPKKNQFNYAGDGVLLTSNKELIQIKNQPKNCKYIKNGRVFYPNGDIFIGMITKEEPYSRIKGILFQNINGNYENYIKSNNFNKKYPYIIKHFNNGDKYEGKSIIRENKCIFNGKGQLTKKDKNTIFNGMFSGNLYNGKGKLFQPLGGISERNNIEDNIGKTIISNFVNGKPNGDALIQEKYSNNENVKNTTCCYRFGKIIKYTNCLVKGKKALNEKIFDFLNIWEISSFANYLKTKSFYNYLNKNNKLNLIKIKIYNALKKNDAGNYSKDIFNNELFKLNIYNFEEILKNVYENINHFLPFVCYRTEGGEIETRYRAFHIFNPDLKKIYSTNYLTHKDSNVIISSIFNRKMFEEYKKEEEQIYDLQDEYIYNLMNWASLYKPLFDKFEKNYPVRKISPDIIEYDNYIILKEKIGNINDILCIIQYITIFIPEKIDDLTFLINPCHFLAIYLGNYDNNQILMENEFEINTDSKNYIDINDNEIKENSYNLNLIRDKYDKYIIKEEYNKDYEYIEFDTNKQKKYDYKILCLIKINKKNKLSVPYIINLKNFYHIGNAINVKLINQFNPYNKNEKGYSIDIGTINFYGDVIYLKNRLS